MALEAGTKLGLYEILDPIGAGGMGEVYRARDTKLGREVAIKVLPEAFAENEERLARFEREAKVLAQLNHPGIAHLYGLERSEGVDYLAMELVDGETLAERIARGPIAVDEALPLCLQIAEAMEAAHEKGIIHRDLKPANIKVSSEGKVKVLDFGLAKAFAEETPEADSSSSPTLTRDSTRAGVILGTAAYMSPEQAKGKTVDKRTDIFSFGIVLYEMLTGKKAFAGEDVSDVLASIMKMEPDWSEVSELDPRIQNLLRRCLRKDRKDRRQSIGDVRVEIQDILAEPAAAVRSEAAKAPTPTLSWVIAGLLAAALLATLWILWPSETFPMRLSMNLGSSGEHLIPHAYNGARAVLSPDGKTLAFVGQRPGGNSQIYLRSLDNLEATPLAGTEGAFSPFFSPDGSWLAFVAAGALKKVSVSGGAALTITDALAVRGGTWGPDDTIVYGTSRTGLYRVPASGGTPVEHTTLREGEQSHRWPWFLPNGEAVLFEVDSMEEATIEAVLLETGERKVVHRGGTYPRYASSGHLLYAREATLFAIPFDPDRIEPTGETRPVIAGVNPRVVGGASDYAFSENGSLVYVPGVVQTNRLVWVDREGREEPLIDEAGHYVDVRISPDSTKVAVSMASSTGPNTVWIYEAGGEGRRTRLAADGGGHLVWTPDGTRVAFDTGSGLYWIPADGSGEAEPLLTSEHGAGLPDSWSPDGELLTFSAIRGSASGRDIWVLPRDGEPSVFLATSFTEDGPMFSPDGRWLAYTSNESGRQEVYVQPYPGPGRKYPISTEGGRAPTWSGKGDELFYRSPDATRMMVVPVELEPWFRPGTPRILFEGRYFASSNGDAHYDVAPDGRRFVMIKESEQESASVQINLVLNWFEELKELAPTK